MKAEESWRFKPLSLLEHADLWRGTDKGYIDFLTFKFNICIKREGDERRGGWGFL